jgi:hypothetical protein
MFAVIVEVVWILSQMLRPPACIVVWRGLEHIYVLCSKLRPVLLSKYEHRNGQANWKAITIQSYMAHLQI